MSHNAFNQREIEHLQEQNARIVSQVEIAETERDHAYEQIKACESRDASLNQEISSANDTKETQMKRLQQNKIEIGAKDEHVKVLGEQNNQMLSLLEAEENKSKNRDVRILRLEEKNRKLQNVADQFDVVKAELESSVFAAKENAAKAAAALRLARGANEVMRTNIQNIEATTRVEVESLGQALEVIDRRNLEYLKRINKQETKEQQLEAETISLKEENEKVNSEIEMLRKLLSGDEEGRTEFERRRSQVEITIEALEVQVDTLKKALSAAERSNEQLQNENRTSGDRVRETADKVYALMDSLRLNKVELKKAEAANTMKEKKIQTTERTAQNLQAKISMECDAKVMAEQERREAEQDAVVLKKRNQVIEENVIAAQTAQENCEKKIALLNETVCQEATRNAYLASRIDAQEEEKNSLKAEVSKMDKKTKELVADNVKTRENFENLEDDVATKKHGIKSYKEELEYIKREDALDAQGRQRPILIQSIESDLLEKLQVNEFLYEAQQARNPVPPLVEKIAQLLAMLQEGQSRADQHLASVKKSTGLLSCLRQRNVVLFQRTHMFESFKTRALLRYIMNLIEGGLMGEILLDGLSFGPNELKEFLAIVPKYEAQDKIYIISLIDNGLGDESITQLTQFIYQLPYLRKLDLKQNCFSDDGRKNIEEQLREMGGVTGVVTSPEGTLNVHSGNQLRLIVDMADQIPKEKVAPEIDFSMEKQDEVGDVDPFLATNKSESGHPWTKTQNAKNPKPPNQAVPDASSKAMLDCPSSAPQPPVIGGPPVGLGGPGNVSALNRKAINKNGFQEAGRRQPKRAKDAPPAPLDEPTQRALDKLLGDRPSRRNSRPASAIIRSGISDLNASPQIPLRCRPASAERNLTDRSQSMPTLLPLYAVGIQRKTNRSPAPLASRRRSLAGKLRPPRS